MTLTTMLGSSQASSNAWGPEPRMFCHVTKLIGERNHLKQVFQANGYPAQMVNHTLRTAHTPPTLHPNRRAGAGYYPQVPPLIVCESCQREDREEVQAPWQKTPNQSGRRKKSCIRYRALNARVSTLDKQEEHWRTG